MNMKGMAGTAKCQSRKKKRSIVYIRLVIICLHFIYFSRSAPEGYLAPAEEDYADYDNDSARFEKGEGGSTNGDARGFGQQGLGSDYGDQQGQYGQNESNNWRGNSAVGN
jgi:hypothetical protein